MRTLTAVYDLAHAPASYDFLIWLYSADAVRRLNDCEHMHVVVIPAATPGGFRPIGKGLSQMAKIWRLHNMLLPLCQLFDASYTLHLSRAAMAAYDDDPALTIWPAPELRNLAWYALGFLITLHADGIEGRRMSVRSLTPHPQAREWLKTWLLGKPYITVTLRNTLIPSRNSSVVEWAEFIAWAERGGYQVIVIPDTEDADCRDEIGAMAAIHPIIRHALYSGAQMNLGVGNGPMMLCLCSPDIPYLMFKLLVEDWTATTIEAWTANKLPPGSQPPWAGPHQRLIWADDDFAIIRDAFTEMMAKQEAA